MKERCEACGKRIWWWQRFRVRDVTFRYGSWMEFFHEKCA